ncbi:MAG: phosphoribosyltransferase family protein [Candidatus Heimdallarchaeaceae archaeon]
MSSAESYIDAQEKLMTLNLLKMAFKSFETLESMKSYLAKSGVDVSIANLSRYINGKALPKSKLKDEILKVLIGNRDLDLTIKELIGSHIREWTDSFGNIAVNNTYLLNDSKTLKAILFLAIHQGIIPRDADKIITAEVDGIPVAMTLAHLLNIDCVYARRKKPLGTTECIAEDIQSMSSGRIETIYLPEKFIKQDERVLIVDDVIRSGSTQKALVELVRRSGGIPVKVIILAGVGEHWGKITELNRIPFKVLKPYPESN